MFEPQVAFSYVQLHLSSSFHGLKRFIHVSTLLDVEKSIKLYNKAGDDIKKVLSTPWKLDPNQRKARCAVDIGGLLAPLCREVLLENRYGGELFAPPITVSSLGLGSPTTWHGCPDLRLRPASPGPELNIILPNNSPQDEEESEEEQESEGEAVNVEIKKKLQKLFIKARSQAVATTVVASLINIMR